MNNKPDNSGNEQSPSMEQILQTIRGVITDDSNSGGSGDDDILELTEILEDDLNVLSLDQQIDAISEANEQASSEAPVKDVLSNIDNIIATPKAEEKISAKALDDLFAEPAKPAAKPVEVAPAAAAPVARPTPEPEPEPAVNINKIEQFASNVQEIHNTTFEPPSNSKKSRLISDASAYASSEALKTLVKSVARPTADGLAFRSGSTVEDLVTEMVKPYLKEWLDKNLPNIVKHLVEKEIQKLIPKEED
jgi:cell pole-organizing protein PopZ